jgi:cell wall-associated NlpC family hydrolase
MRTLTRRGFVAGALTVLSPLATRTSGLAANTNEEASDFPSAADLGTIQQDLAAVLVEANPTPEAPSATAGQAIVDFALSYVGYPYVAGGNSPYGFDCSGFTQFVMLNVLGIDIGHAVEGQPYTGAWVEWDAWQPGDVIFFQNTYRAGISHAAIYIGDYQFVHAENESTGVTISSIWSDYYLSRYWGAIRLV